ncbi:MAG TPA: DnaA/Hda family protein [Stellaceae bacterium]|nr:DnaA/Hda family protein [Stellaceae bacterium]
MIQLTFDLPRRTALGRADFLVSDSNAAAVSWIDRWPNWPQGAVVFHGPSGCGKTHLAHLWRTQAGAILVAGADLSEERVASLVIESPYRIAIDAADQAPERVLLHLYNWCLECGGNVLLTAPRPPASWTIALDDLGSRLRAVPAAGIGPPDDALLGAVLVKHFADRQLRVAADVVLYLIRHIERSFAAAANIVQQLDAASLRDNRAITIPLVRKCLAEVR